MEPIIRVVTDSACDLPRRLIERFKIAVVPLVVRFGSEMFDDGYLSPEEFWRKAAGPYHPQTSQPPIGAFEELFERMVEQGRQVLCVTVTSKHSGTFNAARLAAERFGEMVSVFDSHSISLGLGVQVLEAAKAAREGRSMQDIVDLLESLRDRVRITIVLDTLENLRRGGRADGFIHIVDRMTRALKIKPVVNMVDGQLRLLGATRSFRGGLKRVMSLVDEIEPIEYLGVVHARSQERAEEVRNWLAERAGLSSEYIWLSETGAVLASHAGKGVIGVLMVAPPEKT